HQHRHDDKIRQFTRQQQQPPELNLIAATMSHEACEDPVVSARALQGEAGNWRESAGLDWLADHGGGADNRPIPTIPAPSSLGTSTISLIICTLKGVQDTPLPYLRHCSSMNKSFNLP